MNDYNTGNQTTGIFAPHENIVGDIGKYRLERYDQILVLKKGEKSIQLEPMDEYAREIVQNFSEEPGDRCESIYDLRMYKDSVVVTLYTFYDVKRLEEGIDKMVIYLSNENEYLMCSEEGVTNKHLRVDRHSDIPAKLEEIFVRNHSIFVIVGGKTSDEEFRMVGNGFTATLAEDRPGIYTITRISSAPNKDDFVALRQIFGNICFMLGDQAQAEPGKDLSAKVTPVETSMIFESWRQYMEFEQFQYRDDVGKLIIRFTEMKVGDGDIRFRVLDKLPDIEMLETMEFEFVTTSLLSEKNKAIPRDSQTILKMKDDYSNRPIYLRKVKRIAEDWVIFDIPERPLPDDFVEGPGILYKSDFPIKIEQRRRNGVLSEISSKKNQTANMIMRLSNADVVDTRAATNIDPLTDKTFKAMFGKIIDLDPDYRNAMRIALNTPDIALIKGPPGTGKTTLINGIVSRLTESNPDMRILISSEQHDALDNVMKKLNKSKLPPFVISKRYDEPDLEQQNDFERNIVRYQEDCFKLCQDIIEEGKRNDSMISVLTQFVSIMQEIRNDGYSISSVSRNLDDIERISLKFGSDSAIMGPISALKNNCAPNKLKGEDVDPMIKMARRHIESQILDIEGYLEDDGRERFTRLQIFLESEYPDYLAAEEMSDRLKSGDNEAVRSVFDNYIRYVENLKDMFMQSADNPLDVEDSSNKEAVETLRTTVIKRWNSHRKDFYDVVESFAHLICDTDSVSEIIKLYTSVIGSTCAQARKTQLYSSTSSFNYGYVIIDEAARANPLDIMIPIMCGARVLLVGDQEQLPQYVETEIIKKMRDEKEKYAKFDEDLLTKSLFQLLYDNLETAFKDKRLKYPRTAMLSIQYRMHEDIGDYIC